MNTDHSLSHVSCPLCRKEVELRARIPGYRSDLTFDIYECNCCGESFADPLQSNFELYDSIYRQSDRVPGYNRYHSYHKQIIAESKPLDFMAKQEPCYWFVQDYLQSKVDRSTAIILEVGSGLGYLTYALVRAGFNARGVELSSDSVAKAVAMYGDHYQCADALTLSEKTTERFDVILLTEVIEHLAAPAEFLSRCKKLLSPTGVMLVTTPNKGYFPYRNAIWSTDLPPIHLWWFNQNSLSVLAGNAEMNVSFCDFSAWNRWRFRYQKSRGEIGRPLLDEHGVVIVPTAHLLKKRGFRKSIKSFIYCLVYGRRIDMTQTNFIGAIFSDAR